MCYERSLIERSLITNKYKGDENGTKICLYAKNLNQLIRAYKECREASISYELIIDRNHILMPHFNGIPVINVLSINPVY